MARDAFGEIATVLRAWKSHGNQLRFMPRAMGTPWRGLCMEVIRSIICFKITHAIELGVDWMGAPMKEERHN